MSDSFRVKNAKRFVKAEHKEVPVYTEHSAAKFFAGELPAKGTGKGVKVCIVGTGLPNHRSLKNVYAGANLGVSENSADIEGHSYATAGLIAANEPGSLLGIAPDSRLSYAKATNDSGVADSVVISASIVWAVVIGCQVIVVSNTPTSPCVYLDNAVKKAVESDAIVIFDGTVEGAVIPEGGISSASIVAGEQRLLTTYCEESFCEVDASDFTAAILGGVAAIMVEHHLASGKDNKCRMSDYVSKTLKV